MDTSPKTTRAHTKREWMEAIGLARDQGLLANRWYLAWFFWMEALWLNARLEKKDEANWDLICEDDNNVVRQIGSWRRRKRVETFASHMAEANWIRVASTTKTLVCGWGGDRLRLSTRHIRGDEPPWAMRIQDTALFPQYLWSKRILNVELTIGSAAIKLRDAIAFYSTLQSLFHECLRLVPVRLWAREMHARDAFCVSTPNLLHVLAELNDISEKTATTLLTASTLAGGAKESLWGRPFVFAGESERLIFLPALKSSLLRTLNDLIDQHAGDHGRKGIFFQEHCREQISSAVREGPLKGIAWVAPKAVDTPVGDIDICMFVGDVLLVIEAKFLQVPSDAHEVWRVDQTLKDASLQVLRKVDFIASNKESFLRFIQKEHGAPKEAKVAQVVPLIVSSDSYHAGFPVDGVDVADLPILAVFFDNAFVEIQEIHSDGRVRERVATIYANAADAPGQLKGYLREPEIVKRLRKQIAFRQVPYKTNLHVGDKELVVTLRGVEVVPPDQPVQANEVSSGSA